MSTSIVEHVLSRVENTYLLPIKVVETALFNVGGAVIGVAATGLSVLSFGIRTQTNAYADCVKQFKRVLPWLYIDGLSILNPKVTSLRTSDRQGVLTAATSAKIFSYSMNCSKEKGFFKRHVVSRGACLVAMVAAVFARTLDLLIAVPPVIASIILGGAFKKVNQFAVDQLSSLGLISDLCTGLRGFENPQQFHRRTR